MRWVSRSAAASAAADRLASFLRLASRLGLLLLLLARARVHREPIGLQHAFIEERAQLLSRLGAHVADDDVTVG